MDHLMQDWFNIAQVARIGGWAVYPLAALAILAIVIILDRTWVLLRFASISTTYGDHAASKHTALPRQHAARRLLEPLSASIGKPLWWLEDRASARALDIQRDMSKGLWVLETIVTAAPLLGLLGTIAGMMQAFRLIGNNGLVNPTGVTGGVAQALVATAIGLVIALVALFAFNYFSRRIDRLIDELEVPANSWLNEHRLAEGQAKEAS
jgi:biopolymer transport protein ExbB